MYWDRFDICEAYYMAGCLNHSGQDSKGYAILSKLVTMGYKPSPHIEYCDPNNLTSNGREIYDSIDKVTL